VRILISSNSQRTRWPPQQKPVAYIEALVSQLDVLALYSLMRQRKIVAMFSQRFVNRSKPPSMKSHMPRLLMLALLTVSFTASAIVIRHDVDDSKYRVPASEFPALVDLPGEGHGVLIAPQWVITAAHAITWQSEIKQVAINGIARDVEHLLIHPGYQKPPQALLDQALATWDWTLFRTLLSASDDLALLKLAKRVDDVSPVAINKRDGEFGQVIKIIGKGATGNGVTGYKFSSSHRTELRRAYNKVTSANGRWFCYRFDKPSRALPIEGGSGSGDSGGPILIKAQQGWLLAGLTSWSDPQSANRTPGRYGQFSCNVRLSHYQDWIESAISAQPQVRQGHGKQG
jgi:chymotrypsin